MKSSIKYSLPALILLVLFVGIPTGLILVLSVYKTNFMTWEFVGFENYGKALHGAFPVSVVNSLLYLLFLGIPASIIALVIAISMIDFPKGYLNRVLTLFMIPIFSAGIIISQMWRWVIRVFEIDMANRFTGVPFISLMTLLCTIGPNVLLISMTAKNINPAQYEAAQLEGASWFQIKLRIVLPQLWKIYVIILLFSMIGAMQIWEFIYMTAPYDSTASMMYRIVTDGFMYGKYGLAATEVIVMLMIILGITQAKNYIERRSLHKNSQ